MSYYELYFKKYFPYARFSVHVQEMCAESVVYKTFHASL